ncbi:MAG: hypothetical protein KGD60_12325, partial [Candidatus Thorarchaeota archaeon]|nr:hypothetical protein [Candidatus Thorarchaeota archaeon]
LGAVLSTVGMMIASGIDQGGNVYDAFHTVSLFFVSLSVVVMVVFWPELFKDEQNQSQAEPDSSLI